MDKLDQLFNFYHILYLEIIKIIKKVIKIYKYSSEISILIFSLYFSSYLQKKNNAFIFITLLAFTSKFLIIKISNIQHKYFK